MILLRILNEKVIEVGLNISPSYEPKNNEVVIESLPHVSINDDEIAEIYYRNNNVEYEIKKRGN